MVVVLEHITQTHNLGITRVFYLTQILRCSFSLYLTINKF